MLIGIRVRCVSPARPLSIINVSLRWYSPALKTLTLTFELPLRDLSRLESSVTDLMGVVLSPASVLLPQLAM